MNRLELSQENGNGKRKTTAKKTNQRKKAGIRPITKFRRVCTVLLGCGIPLLSLALSRLAGNSFQHGSHALGFCFLALCGTVLAVSLQHLAHAIGDITKSPETMSWLLAVAVDASLVMCELHHVFVPTSTDAILSTAVMVGCTTSSMVLNVYAFLKSK